MPDYSTCKGDSAVFHWVNHKSNCTRLIYAQKSIIITQHSNYDKYCVVHSGKPSSDYIHYVLAKVCQKRKKMTAGSEIANDFIALAGEWVE
jgi:hypothetical protein